MFGLDCRLRTLILIIAAAAVPVSTAARMQWATADRLQSPGWWPTKDTARRADFVGTDGCRECHRSQAAVQPSTAMARTAMAAADSPVLRASTHLAFDAPGASYRITAGTGGPLYTVARGGETFTARLTWAFGAGDVGQSFLLTHTNGFFEARVSYYASRHALGFTPGRALTASRALDEAAGRRVDPIEIRRCFSCHTTAPVTEKTFNPATAIPGVTCEACHGPGRRHVEVMKDSHRVGGSTEILNPANLRAVESIDFCGACHATLWDVRLAGESGLAAQRSQPYRLQMSRCWTSGADSRLTCVACHDPHRPLVRGAAAYDDRCLSCHTASGAQPDAAHPGRTCPVAASNCASCHMPKYEVPDMHHEFTDHLIQVPRLGAGRVGP
jgi:hypothetical protein